MPERERALILPADMSDPVKPASTLSADEIDSLGFSTRYAIRESCFRSRSEENYSNKSVRRRMVCDMSQMIAARPP
jgi:hypothetical protein